FVMRPSLRVNSEFQRWLAQSRPLCEFRTARVCLLTVVMVSLLYKIGNKASSPCLNLAIHQNRSFKANWICREVPTIDVIVPALEFGVPLLLNAPRVVEGKLKLVWF